MHEIHVLPKLCGKFSEMLFRFAFPHASLSMTKRVKDASAHNQKNVLRNCGMWDVLSYFGEMPRLMKLLTSLNFTTSHSSGINPRADLTIPFFSCPGKRKCTNHSR